jgi:hypothetical protein
MKKKTILKFLPTEFNEFGEKFSMAVKKFRVDFFADMMLLFEILISLNSRPLSRAIHKISDY